MIPIYSHIKYMCSVWSQWSVLEWESTQQYLSTWQYQVITGWPLFFRNPAFFHIPVHNIHSGYKGENKAHLEWSIFIIRKSSMITGESMLCFVPIQYDRLLIWLNIVFVWNVGMYYMKKKSTGKWCSKIALS